MPADAIHHRRLAAARNEQAILDATVRLLEEGRPATMAAVASAAGLTRPTVYAHFADRAALLEAVAQRAVRSSRAAIELAAPGDGDALQALERVVVASWEELHRHASVVRAAAAELSGAARRRVHEEGFAPVRELIGRGRREGAFRRDVPESWLLAVFDALLHATAAEVLAGRAPREQAGDLLRATLIETFRSRARSARAGLP